MTEEQQIQSLHAAYVRLTGLPLPLNMSRRFVWLAWMARGFTEQDLATLVSHYRKTVDKEPIRMRMLRFDRFIGDTQRFEEDLAEAKAMTRTRPPALQQIHTGDTTRLVPNPGTQDTSRKARDVVKGIDPTSRWTTTPQTLADWEAMKQSLKP
jgi:hypothetical protein